MTDDPMLTEKADTYRENVMDSMRAAIEEDRRARRQSPSRSETPATLVGATGMPGGLAQTL